MTVKLVVLYTKPEDAAAFDAHYRDTHLPLADKIPGLLRWELAHFGGAADGGEVPYHQIAELYFADQAAVDAAFGSAEGQATAADYGKIAPEGSRLLIAEVTGSSADS
jgi:uncharacterized protein (TIGR02118 family)